MEEATHFAHPRPVDLLQLHRPCVDIAPFFVEGYGVDAFGLPSRDPLVRLGDLAFYNLVSFAGSAFDVDSLGLVDQLHSAGFAGPIFFGAVCAETTPPVVLTGENLLLVEAHIGMEDVRRLKLR